MIPNDMKTVENNNRKRLRRVAPIAVLCGGLGVALVAGARAPRTETILPVVVADTEDQQSAQAPDKPLTSEYQKSQFSDVMVRSIDASPSEASAAKGTANNARYVLKPGSKRKVSEETGYGATATETPVVVSLPNGQGVSRLIPASQKVYERVHTSSGHVIGIRGEESGSAHSARGTR
jgi:hypothetical protein